MVSRDRLEINLQYIYIIPNINKNSIYQFIVDSFDVI